jgi:hypothetical protein
MKPPATPETYKEDSRNDINQVRTIKRGYIIPDLNRGRLITEMRVSDLHNNNLIETTNSTPNLSDEISTHINSSSLTLCRDNVTTTPYPAVNENKSKLNISAIKYPKQYNRRYCCGYFKTRSGCCFAWLAFIIVSLVSLGFLGYYYRPIFPQFIIGSPYIPLDSKPLITLGENESFSTLIKAANKTNPFIMGYTYAVNVSIFSQMKMNIDISVISLTVNIQ